MRYRALAALLGALAILLPAAAQARELYVTDQGDDSLGIVDLATKTVAATVPVGHLPTGVAVTPDGTQAFVTDDGTSDVSVVDLATRTVVATVPVGTAPAGIAISPDGSLAYVANTGSGSVSVIDTAADAVTNTITVGTFPRAIAVSPDGATVYVTNQTDNTLSVIDAATGTVTNTVALPRQPLSLSISPDGSRLYVASAFGSLFGGNDITVLDTSSLTAVGSAVKSFTFAVAASPDGSQAYAASSSVSNITLAGALGNTVSVGAGLGQMAVTPDSQHVYVPSNGSNQVFELTTSPLAVVGPINVGASPQAVAIGPDQGPTARFATAAGPNNFTSFDALTSSDSNSPIARYAWDFGDGVTEPNGGPTPSHIYSAPGTYDVSVTVTNGEGCSTSVIFTGQTASCNGGPKATMTKSVTVAGPPAPTCTGASVAVGHDQPTAIALSCSSAATVLAISSPPQHGTLSAIDQTDGTVTYTPNPGYAGTDSFRFTGSGTDGTSQPATVALTVGPAPPAQPAAPAPPAAPPPPDRIAPLLSIPRLVGGRIFRVFVSEASTLRIGLSRCSHGHCHSLKRLTRVTHGPKTVVITLSRRRLRAGTYLLSAFGVDSAGNRSVTEKRRVTIR